MGDWIDKGSIFDLGVAHLKEDGYRIVKLKHWGTWPHDFNFPEDKTTLWSVEEEL